MVEGGALPSAVEHGNCYRNESDKIYLIGGKIDDQILIKFSIFDPSSNQWTSKANMPTARHGHKLVWFENRIWAIGGRIIITVRKLKATTLY